MNGIDQFVENWCSKNTMVPINIEAIKELEEKLGAVLPDSYKYLLATYGLVHTPNVLTRTCDLDTDVSEVQDFLSLDDVYSLSKLYEMSGMPKGHILFASDCKGNMFCFKLTDCDSKQIDLPVWYFDHSLQTVEQACHSFIGWLEEFNAV